MKPLTKNIPFARPALSEAEAGAVIKVLQSGWLTTASVAADFENQFKDYVGTEHALAVNSATSGLHLALHAVADIKPGDYVITSPYTFAATAEVIRYFGAHPLFVDVDDDYMIDPELFKKAVKGRSNIKACIAVHFAGRIASSFFTLLKYAKEAGIPLIEDAAHSFPGKTEAGYAGTLADIGVYSFYATKTITTAEGGMIVTDNQEYVNKIKPLRLHGISRDVWDRYTSTKAGWEYDIIAAGYKYNMPDVLAAIGRVQLSRAEELKAERKKQFEQYNQELANLDYLELPKDDGSHSFHLYDLKIDAEILGFDRDEFFNRLQSQGIGCSVHFKPLHIMSYYKETYGYSESDFPNAMKLFKQEISLPMYPGLSRDDISYICKAIQNVREL